MDGKQELSPQDRTPTYLKQFRNHLNDTLLEWIGKLADGLDINQFNKCIDPG